MKKPSILLLALLSGSHLHAAITEYTDLTTFLALLQPGFYSESFASLTPGDQAVSSLAFSGGSPALSLTIETRNAANNFAGDPLYLADTGNTDKALGTSVSQNDQLRIHSTNFFAIGADWFLSDQDENYVPASVTLTFSDSSTFTVVSTTQANSFRGYISDAPLASVRVTGPGTDFVTTDNLVLGTPVPEPTGASLLVLGGLALLARRRRG